MRIADDREAGFTLIEVSVATVVLFISIVMLAGILLSVHRQRELSSARHLVLDEAIAVIEGVRGSDPQYVARDYNGQTFGVPGVQGTGTNGDAISVNVDTSDPKLVKVAVNGAWVDAGNNETLQLETLIHSSKGQSYAP